LVGKQANHENSLEFILRPQEEQVFIFKKKSSCEQVSLKIQTFPKVIYPNKGEVNEIR